MYGYRKFDFLGSLSLAVETGSRSDQSTRFRPDPHPCAEETDPRNIQWLFYGYHEQLSILKLL